MKIVVSIRQRSFARFVAFDLAEAARRLGWAVQWIDFDALTQQLQGQPGIAAAIPAIPGWSIAGLYSPAGPMNQVGGDFYDLLRIEGGWMAVIGDVTGHGARAASLTAMARYTLRTASTITNDPKRALAELNRALLQRPGGALCSVAAFTLDQPALVDAVLENVERDLDVPRGVHRLRPAVAPVVVIPVLPVQVLEVHRVQRVVHAL